MTPTRKRFAIISAVYNVADYLHDFIESIEAQDFDPERLEIVMVDDGSTDDSPAILAAWAQRRPELVTVLRQENAGQASARNHGLTLATAEWVTFIDPDDMIDEGYLTCVDGLITRYPGIPMVATNRWYYEEGQGGVLRDGHPLRSMFADGDKKVELDRFPQYFWNSVGAGFFLLDEFRRLELCFDTRVWPNFEDAHLCVRYQLGTGQSMILAASARHLYRRRANNSSTLQTSAQKPEKFTAVPRYGYLDALQAAKAQFGFVPEWLQNHIIYELTWYFSTEDQITGSRTAAVGEVGAEFVRLLREIRSYLDDTVIEAFRVRPLSRATRDLLLHAFSEERWHSPTVKLDRYDMRYAEVRMVYRYVGDPPVEEVLIRGLPAEKLRAKTREMSYFGQVLMRERIIWASAKGTLRVVLNGVASVLHRHDPEIPNTYLRPAAVGRMFGVRPPAPPAPSGRTQRKKATPAERQVQRLTRKGRRGSVRRRFQDAWVFIDRTHQAGDNAERLFEYVRTTRPDINAWFVIEEGTSDWARLRGGQFRDRVVPYGSEQWKLLMLHCAHLVSSHVDAPIVSPPELRPLRPVNWKYTFLQHGVTKDDLSRWLNIKWMMSLLVTATQPEYDSIALDGPYVFTPKEVQLTGFPRHDRLLRLGEATSLAEQDLILVAPTWRQWLNQPVRPGTQYRELITDFASTDYARQWGELLASTELQDHAAKNGLRIGFLPHPNLKSAAHHMSLPTSVEVLSYEDHDVQQLLARTRLMITDYSSLAFEAAYLERPVVYFQFDPDLVLAGDHLYRPGYFNYVDHGFGPVAKTVDEVVDGVVKSMADLAVVEWPYPQRARQTFPLRDGGACARVVAAIEAL